MLSYLVAKSNVSASLAIETGEQGNGLTGAREGFLIAVMNPALPLFFRAEAYFFPKWLKGVHPTGHMSTTTTWVEEWTAEKE